MFLGGRMKQIWINGWGWWKYEDFVVICVGLSE